LICFKESRGTNVKGPRQTMDICQRDVPQPSFDAGHVRGVESCAMSQTSLRQPCGFTEASKPVAEVTLPAALLAYSLLLSHGAPDAMDS
jgi:hypothetical protein